MCGRNIRAGQDFEPGMPGRKANTITTELKRILSNAVVIPRQMKFTGISLSVGRAVGRSGGGSVRKILSRQLLQFQSNSLDTWQKCSLGAVDVQDTHFVQIPSRITELLPLI